MSVLIDVGMKLLAWWLKRSENRAQALKKFYEFWAQMEDDGMTSSNLNKSDREQIDELRRRRLTGGEP